MIQIDGSAYSGSGTLLRYAVALATLTRKPLRMTNIRARRPKPGLRPQHLLAVKACSVLSGGRLTGAEVDSQTILYEPGISLHGGDFHFDIGTAGSATMLAFTLIPVALFSECPSKVTITGGLFQDFTPSFFHLREVLLPLVVSMGAEVRLNMIRPGYVPRGGGKLEMQVNPVQADLKPIQRVKQGKITAIKGIALASHLAEQAVAKRMAERCREKLRKKGHVADIAIMEDATAAQKGASLIIWAETTTGCLIGADQAGKPGRRSEAIADFVALTLLEDLDSGATTDRHLADQLILFGALAGGTTEYTIPVVTDHVQANLWLVEEILGAKTLLSGTQVQVHGIGFGRDHQ
jgi:RNA 3'-terminal phosphate cyclase (ATP)